MEPSTSCLEPSKTFKTNIHYINEEFCNFLLGWFAIRELKTLSQDITGHKLGDLMNKNKLKMAKFSNRFKLIN